MSSSVDGEERPFECEHIGDEDGLRVVIAIHGALHSPHHQGGPGVARCRMPPPSEQWAMARSSTVSLQVAEFRVEHAFEGAFGRSL